jgi:hypothetical protein
MKPLHALVDKVLLKANRPNRELERFFRPDLAKTRLKKQRFKEQGCQTAALKSLQSSVISSPIISRNCSLNIRNSSHYSAVRMKSLSDLPVLSSPLPVDQSKRVQRSQILTYKEMKLDPDVTVTFTPLTIEKVKSYIRYTSRERLWRPAYGTS